MVTGITPSTTRTDAVADGNPDGAVDRLVDAAGRNVLVSGGPMEGAGAFAEAVAGAATADGRDALLVTATRSAPRRSVGASDGLHVVDCSPAEVPESGRVTNAGSPSDLTGVSMPVSKFVQAAGRRPVVAVDSLTALLMYADQAAVFRLLSVVTTQVRNADGLGLFTVDEGCHDDQTIRTFAQLFDGRVDVGPEGTAESPELSEPEV